MYLRIKVELSCECLCLFKLLLSQQSSQSGEVENTFMTITHPSCFVLSPPPPSHTPLPPSLPLPLPLPTPPLPTSPFSRSSLPPSSLSLLSYHPNFLPCLPISSLPPPTSHPLLPFSQQVSLNNYLLKSKLFHKGVKLLHKGFT